MNIVITGVTGLLGRNLLFEIIKNNLDRLDKLKIYLLGRKKDSQDLTHRLEDIMINDGSQYIFGGPSDLGWIRHCFERVIVPIEMDLRKESLALNYDDVKKLLSEKIDIFFHVASLTDFRRTPAVADNLKNSNVNGTKQILELAKSLKVGEFSYVGSAYSCGNSSGSIEPDYINLNQEFRNPYEKSKLEAEMLVRGFKNETNIKCRIFRPSTICGRLIEKPQGAINKYDVFYAWGAWFLRMKLRMVNSIKELYDKKMRFDIRVCYSNKSGLNIVPVDYIAKIMYGVHMHNDKNDSFYLANEQETDHGFYVNHMLKTFNISGIRRVDSEPIDCNKYEKFYYKTVGDIFTPYVNSNPMLFSTRNLSGIKKKLNLECPAIDCKNIKVLIDFAKSKHFGINIKDLLSRKKP